MKIIVKTTGKFALMDPSGAEIRSQRPTVCNRTGFIDQRVKLKQVEIVAEDLPAEATDLEFEAFWRECEGDFDLAVESYLAKLKKDLDDKEAEKAKKPAPRRRGG